MSGSAVRIKEGMRILIEVDAPDTDEATGENHTVSLSSIVEDVIDDRDFVIQMPMYKNYNYPLPRDRPITVFVFTDTRMFSLAIRYMEPLRAAGIEYAKVRRVSELTPSQRRECYRLESTLPINVVRVPRDENADLVITKSQIINLSDGGILFTTDDDFELGDEIILTIDLNEEEENTWGEVIRTESTWGVGIYKHRVTAKFNHKDPRQKERFYRYIVEQQREKLRQQMRDR
ncbi:MAG: flagellar brake protein [Clostridiales bacterium]|jgi:c-di-GMP-binding flagellar brake protein YcgR|nr:flagellar brake protein [Clostridiales bacterium]